MQYYQGRYPILEKKLLAKNMVQYVIFCPEIAAVAQPGQFVHILPIGHTLRRPISLCEIQAEKGTICIVFELKGSGTETLANCNVGDCMDVLGPLGHGFTLLPDAKRVILLGGGIGNPPMLPLARYYQGRAAVISGFRSAEFV
ncbi:MAG: dihydroorotate dehydrogenase electron transfer subunit, partial [Ruminococcus sp.]